MGAWRHLGRIVEIDGKDCQISLVARPVYCDRGNWVAQLEARAGSELARDLDWADGWPRYYFDLDRAKLEIEAWLRKRGQWIEANEVPVGFR